MPEGNATNAQVTPPPAGESQEGGKEQFESFEAFLEGQTPEVKALYEGHTTGLRNSVAAARKERDDLSKLLKEATKQAQDGSELQKQLTQIGAQLEMAERRATFAEEAIRPEIGCSNAKAAFLIAQADDLFKKDGSPDWEGIKRAAPELFKKPGSANATAGNGTGDDANKLKPSMNDAIRRAAGR
ncbi:MAG TPA: hypothetical protein PK040_02085 [Anaerolineaceae bacterium]|nr:hypothetical protein [Anaerolineaceae bacterium]